MPVTETMWGQVEIGTIVRDKKDHMWWVRAERDGQLLLDNGRATLIIDRPPHTSPVGIYTPTEAEAINLANEALGGRILRIIEEREHDISRAPTWRLEELPRNARQIRDHLDMIHNVRVDDLLRRWQGTQANPATPKSRKAALDELVEAHQYAHDNPGIFPSPFPHVHTLEARHG